MSSSNPSLEIGLIGAGDIGSALAAHLRRLGHEVLISNSRGPETLQELAKELGVKSVTSAEAAAAKDIVIISIPQLFTPKLKTLFVHVPSSVIVIDTNNYYPGIRDGTIAEIEEGVPDSAWVAKQIGRPVVKVFNSIMHQSLRTKGKPKGTPGRIGLAVSGDPKEHRERVMALVDQIGFDPVDNGDLANSWRQQPGTPGYCLDWDEKTVKEGLATAVKEKVNEYRRTSEQQAMQYHSETIERKNRQVQARKGDAQAL
jgi:predicted dinucleotide-binding enzyme